MERNTIIRYSIFGGLPILLIIFLLIYRTFNDPNFFVEEIPENLKNKLIMNNVWSKNCPVQLNRLRIINIQYYSAENKINKDGQFLILDVVAENVLNIFKTLYKKKIVIEKIDDILVDRSHQELRANNVSIGFICDSDSKYEDMLYKYGLAFDINPLYNPSINYSSNKDDEYFLIKAHSTSRKYINRGLDFKMKNEQMVSIFKENGFSNWGGNWPENMNYQYFSVDNEIAEIIFLMNLEDGKEFFKIITNNIKYIDRIRKDVFITEMKYLYQKNGRKFLTAFNSNISKLKKLNDSQFFALLRKEI